MLLTQWETAEGNRWKCDDKWLDEEITLGALLCLKSADMQAVLEFQNAEDPGKCAMITPIDGDMEVWASGVTYLRSRMEREAESTVADVYAKVYAADRPELFFKSLGWRAVGQGQEIRIRRDSNWNVPEPELTLIINQHLEIVGYTAGNDVSSRQIEGENPLYLPQAKSYNGSCAIGPGIVIQSEGFQSIPILLEIEREGQVVFSDSTNTDQMKRKVEDLVAYLGREMDFPIGVLLMTGTGIVPAAPFTLAVGDKVRVTVGELILENVVSS